MNILNEIMALMDSVKVGYSEPYPGMIEINHGGVEYTVTSRVNMLDPEMSTLKQRNTFGELTMNMNLPVNSVTYADEENADTRILISVTDDVDVLIDSDGNVQWEVR